MKAPSKKIVFTALVVIATMTILCLRYRKPLTPAEANLVGNWSAWSLNPIGGQQPQYKITYKSDGTFCKSNGNDEVEVIGQWWISAGKLNYKYYIYYHDQSIFPRRSKAFTEIRQIKFGKNGNRAKLSRPGNSSPTMLVRSSETAPYRYAKPLMPTPENLYRFE